MAPSVAVWVLESGAGFHMTGNLQLLRDGGNLVTYDHQLADALRMSDGDRSLHILGCGSVKTDRIEVPNVRYLQGLTVNVISVLQLSREHSLEVTFEPRYCHIMKSGGQIVGRGARSRNGIYVLEYLRIRLEDDASLNTPMGTSEDDGSPPQAGPDPNSWSGLSPSDISDPGTACGVEAGRPGAMEPSVAEWVLDFEVEVHVTGNLQLLRDGGNLVTYDLQLADALRTFGRDRSLHILGCGSVKTDRIEVPNVRYAQGFKMNIFSEVQLRREHSLKVVLEPKYCYIRKRKESGGQIVGRGARSRDGNIYVLEYLRIRLEDDASLNMPTGTSDADDDDRSQPQAAPDPDSCVGSDIPTVNSCCDHVCTGRSTRSTSTGTPSQHFYMDSGACCHSTGDPSVLQRYPDYLNVQAPITSLGGFVNGPPVPVEGCGYVNRDGVMKLDGVLYIPCAPKNLVSVGQLAKQYGVRTVFDKDLFRVEKLQNGEMIGLGHREEGGNHYVLDRFLPGGLFVDAPEPIRLADMFGNVKFPQQPS